MGHLGPRQFVREQTTVGGGVDQLGCLPSTAKSQTVSHVDSKLSTCYSPTDQEDSWPCMSTVLPYRIRIAMNLTNAGFECNVLGQFKPLTPTRTLQHLCKAASNSYPDRMGGRGKQEVVCTLMSTSRVVHIYTMKVSR